MLGLAILMLLVHHLSDVYINGVKSDIYIYLGRVAGEGSRVTHHLKLNVYLQLEVAITHEIEIECCSRCLPAQLPICPKADSWAGWAIRTRFNLKLTCKGS